MTTPALPILLLALAGCKGSSAPEDGAPAAAAEAAPIDVETAPAEQRDMPTRVPLVGTLVAERQAQIAADSNGVVVQTKVERGDKVKKGEVLVVIDSRTAGFSAMASSAQALAQAAQADIATKDCARADELYRSGVIATAQYERTKAACDAQGKAADAARASADLAGSNLERTKVKAPFAGVIGERMVEIGAFVQAASPVATLYASGPLRVRMSVPETQSGGVVEGNAVTVFPTALDGVSVAATVKYVAGAIREQTRDLVVEAQLGSEDPRLRPGMSVRVELDTGKAPAVVVPETAIRMTDGVASIFVVKDGTVLERVVRLGARDEGKVTVLTDLAAGEEVVLAPPAALRDGGKVN